MFYNEKQIHGQTNIVTYIILNKQKEKKRSSTEILGTQTKTSRISLIFVVVFVALL